MRPQKHHNHSIIKVFLSLVIATSPVVANVLFNLPSYAESESNQSNTKSEFTLPKTMEQGTIINIDGSVNSVILNQSLKENFEKMFSGTQVKIGINGNEDAVKSLINGTVDLASLGRKLTPEEKAQGLEQLLIRREKIAIIVGAKNSFDGKLTTKQFAKIFRGEITNWSELGGENKPIKFIDRPSNSDTRNSLQEYEAFSQGEFKTGSNAIQITDDNTTEIVKQLGDDGISYALANQIVKLPDVKTIKIEDFTPEQDNYPFSQSFVYVYRKNPDAKVEGFLGFISSKFGQKSVESTRQVESLAIATSILQNINTNTTTNFSTNPDPKATNNTSNNTPGNNSNTSTFPQQPFITSIPQAPENDQRDMTIFSSLVSKENAKLIFLLIVLVTGLGSLILYLWLTRKKKVAVEANSETPQIEEINIPTVPSESELQLTIADNNTNLNGINQQDNSKTIVTDLEENLTFNENHNNGNLNNGNLVVIDAPIDIPNTPIDLANEAFTEENISELWDIEAPVIVVNNHYLQFPNMAQNAENPNNLKIDGNQLATSENQVIQSNQDELATSATSLNSENQELENKEEQRVNNISELLKIAPITLNPNGNLSLSELLGIKPIGSPTSDFPETLNTALNNIVEPESNYHPEPTPSTTTEISSSPIDLPNDVSELELNNSVNSDVIPSLNHDLGNDLGNGVNNDHSLNINNACMTLETTAESIEIDFNHTTKTPENTTKTDFNCSSNTKIIFTPRSPKWGYVSWEIDKNDQQTLLKKGIENLAIRLYDVTYLDLSYQKPILVQQYDCEATINDCYVFIPQGEKDYITELGYTTPSTNINLIDSNLWFSLARSGIVRFFSRPHGNIWLVVDTELVIHGATKQGANVTVDGQEVKLNDDGTFKLKVPLVDNVVDYQITATTPTGKESKTIHQKFSQEQKEIS